MSEAEESRSRRTIGLTQPARDALEEIQRQGWFATEAGAFKTAVAYAIARDVPETAGGQFTTKWNVGSLDPDGDFAETCRILLDTDDPWDRIQRLGDAGLREMANRMRISEVLSDVVDFGGGVT